MNDKDNSHKSDRLQWEAIEKQEDCRNGERFIATARKISAELVAKLEANQGKEFDPGRMDALLKAANSISARLVHQEDLARQRTYIKH